MLDLRDLLEQLTEELKVIKDLLDLQEQMHQVDLVVEQDHEEQKVILDQLELQDQQVE